MQGIEFSKDPENIGTADYDIKAEKTYEQALQEYSDLEQVVNAWRGVLYQAPDRQLSLDSPQNQGFKKALESTNFWKNSELEVRERVVYVICHNEIMVDPVLTDEQRKKKEERHMENLNRVSNKNVRWPSFLDTSPKTGVSPDEVDWEAEVDKFNQ